MVILIIFFTIIYVIQEKDIKLMQAGKEKVR